MRVDIDKIRMRMLRKLIREEFGFGPGKAVVTVDFRVGHPKKRKAKVIPFRKLDHE